MFFQSLPMLSSHPPPALEADAEHPHSDEGERLWLCVLAGVVAVYLVEALRLRTEDQDDRRRHRAVAGAAVFGLTLQALFAGVALVAGGADGEPAPPTLITTAVHSGAYAFALATLFRLAEMSRGAAVAATAAFALLAPAGLLVGGVLERAIGHEAVFLLAAFAAGIFLFVSLCELLPEIFHRREDVAAKIALLLAGIAAAALRLGSDG